jgi:phenylacetate-CoA ligase
MIPDRFKTSVFFAKYYLYNRRAIEYYRTLERNQHLSVDELEELNWSKRKKLLSYAYDKVPYYREKFGKIGLHPNDIKRREDFQNVPLLERKDLKENFRQLISEEADPRYMIVSTTGGTTGEPVKVVMDKRMPLDAMGWRAYRWWGIEPGLNSALVWRYKRSGLSARVINHLMWWPSLRITLDATSMTISSIERFIKKFNLIRPRMLHGYVGALDHVAGVIIEKGYRVVPPKAVSATSCPLSVFQRRRIEDAFGAPVYDQYGCCEIFWISTQCGVKKDLHINHDIRFVEFTDEQGKPISADKLGNIVITDFENYYFPLIRYNTNDLGRALEGKCPCGINLPLMDKVAGRTVENIKLPDGVCLSGHYFGAFFGKYAEGLNGFQIRQKKDYSIHLYYVPGPDSEVLSKALTILKKDLEKRTDSQVPITFQAVKEIPHDRGKLQRVISDVD